MQDDGPGPGAEIHPDAVHTLGLPIGIAKQILKE